MKKFNSIPAIALCLVSLSACGSGSGSPPATKLKQLGSFRLAQSCSDIKDYVKDFAKRVQANPGGVVGVQSDGFSRGAPAAAPTAEGAPQDAGSSTVQSDIAVVDSVRGLLFTASREKKLKVVQASPAGQAKIAATLSLDFTPLEMLALRSGNRDLLLVFGSSGDIWYGGPEPLPVPVAEGADSASGGWEEPKSVVALFDVSDVSQIQEIKRETAPGSFLEARAIPGKNAALWVSQRWVPLQSDPVPEPQIFPNKIVSGAGANPSQPVAGCGQSFLYQNDTLEDSYAPYSLNETVINLIDLSSANFNVSSQAIFSPGWRSVIAANPDHLFIAQNIDSSGRPGMELFQFDIANAQSLSFSASIQVPGDILNQFFIDERDGVVRVFHHQAGVTGCADCVSGGEPGSPPMPLLKAEEVSAAGNYLSTYRKAGGQLQLLGRNGPFEETEVPYAARFLGSLGCAITFEQIDPLTCFDLKDPAPSRQARGT